MAIALLLVSTWIVVAVVVGLLAGKALRRFDDHTQGET